MKPIVFFALASLAATSPAFAAERDYLVVERSVEVAKPADVTWRQIGDFCYIGKLLDSTCSVETGKGDVGSIRRLNGTTVEVMVAKTQYSYTYSQVEGARANMDYHGTLSVVPINKSRSRILYTLIIDRARLPAGTNMAEYQQALTDRFQGAVDKAKALVEGPAAARRLPGHP